MTRDKRIADNVSRLTLSPSKDMTIRSDERDLMPRLRPAARRLAALCLAYAASQTPISCLAHHSPSAFDTSVEQSIAGIIVDYEWANPHVYIYLKVVDANGADKTWEVEGGPLAMMRRRGWTQDTFSPGERVTITGNPSRDRDAHTILLRAVERADGEVLGLEELSFTPPSASNQAATGLSGIWAADGGGPAWRLFTNPRLLPLTESGRDAAERYDERTDSQAIDCIPYSIPMAMLLPDIKSIDVGTETVVIRGEFDAMTRTIYLNRRSHEGVDPGYLGHSIGAWEDDTLVVDTARFLPHSQGNATGLASSPRKHVVERFRLNPDRASFTYSVLVEDPEYLEGSVSGEMQYRYRPDLDYSPIECDLDNARRFLRVGR
jgi:Family of unknown function (DUF6152)